MTNEVTASDVVQTGGEKSGDAVPNMGDTTDATTKKKKKSKKSKGKSLEKRGETALNYYRGTGFEGTSSTVSESQTFADSRIQSITAIHP